MINSLAKIYQIIPLKYYIRVIEDLCYLHIFNMSIITHLKVILLNV